MGIRMPCTRARFAALLAAALVLAGPGPASAHFVSGPTPVAPFYMAGLALPQAFPRYGLRPGSWSFGLGGFSASVSRPDSQLPDDLVRLSGGGGYASAVYGLSPHWGAGGLLAYLSASGFSGAAYQPFRNCGATEDCAPADNLGSAGGRGFLGAAYGVYDPTPEGWAVRVPFIAGLAYLNGSQRTHVEGFMPPVFGGPSAFSTLTAAQRREGVGPLLGVAPQLSAGKWVSLSPFVVGVPAGMHEYRSCQGGGNFDCADPGRQQEPLVFTGFSTTLKPAHLSVTYVPEWQAAGVWSVAAGFVWGFGRE